MLQHGSLRKCGNQRKSDINWLHNNSFQRFTWICNCEMCFPSSLLVWSGLPMEYFLKCSYLLLRNFCTPLIVTSYYFLPSFKGSVYEAFEKGKIKFFSEVCNNQPQFSCNKSIIGRASHIQEFLGGILRLTSESQPEMTKKVFSTELRNFFCLRNIEILLRLDELDRSSPRERARWLERRGQPPLIEGSEFTWLCELPKAGL